MACHEETIECDMCGEDNTLWTKFCTVCGIDYCENCKLTHDAQHEFAVEAQGL
jgi:hypothetical protein